VLVVSQDQRWKYYLRVVLPSLWPKQPEPTAASSHAVADRAPAPKLKPGEARISQHGLLFGV
jgi:hypothetical protein